MDIRLRQLFTDHHIAGSLSAPYHQQGWASTIAEWLAQQGDGVAVGVFGDNPVVLKVAVKSLENAGVSVSAAFDGGMAAWQAAGFPVVSVPSLSVDDLASHLDEWVVVDVREPYELRSGIIPGAESIPLGTLEQHVDRFSQDRRYAIVCASGNRSQTASVWLAEHGFQAANVVGGMSLWIGAGHPTAQIP